MKRRTLIVCLIVALIVLLCIVVSFVAQRDLQRRYVDQRFGQSVFREDLAIIAVTFESNINGHGTEPVPEENLQEITNWLRQFKNRQDRGKRSAAEPRFRFCVCLCDLRRWEPANDLS